MQKIRLAFKGWNRRREERDRAFVAKHAWGAPPPTAAAASRVPTVAVDVDGIQIAYLDTSGRTEFYLDTQTGDVIESNTPLDGLRYRRIPSASHEDDRIAFLEIVEDAGDRSRLADADSFRSNLSANRTLEKAWYNFRNDRALRIIDGWLREIGLK
jgi:hypothetical protein